MTRSRWQPVCPECGYSLRGLTGYRCPECGVDFPTQQRTFRRWAVRRIPWDRLDRGSIIKQYLMTILLIFLLPSRAGRVIAIPDRWGRTVRWAAVHFLLLVLVCGLLANYQQFWHWLVEQVWTPSFDPPHRESLHDAPVNRMIIWFAQSVAAWAIVLSVPVLLGILFSIGIPGRHRLAKLNGVKWSLYLVPILVAVVSGWYGYHFIFPEKTTYQSVYPPSACPVFLVAFIYGLWWAAGMALNPYNHTRSVLSFVGFGVIYGGMLVLFRLLFPLGVLEGLL